MGKEQNFSFYPSAISKTGGFSTSKGYVKAITLNNYIAKIPELKNKAKEFAKEEYLAFHDIKTLCKRCHFAEEKGLIPCGYCKKRYYDPINFMSCSDCKEKSQREYEEFEKEIDEKEEQMIEELEEIKKRKP